MNGHQEAVVLVVGIIVAGLVLCSMFSMFTARARAKYGYHPAEDGEDGLSVSIDRSDDDDSR